MRVILWITFLTLMASRIIKGDNVVINTSENLAHLVVIMQASSPYHCIGTLISYSQVLTTSTCIYTNTEDIQVLPLGYLSYTDKENYVRKVYRKFYQIDYSNGTAYMMNRMGVLELTKPFPNDMDSIQPIAIMRTMLMTDEPLECRAIAVELGSNSNEEQLEDNVLIEQIQGLDWKKCLDHNKSAQPVTIINPHPLIKIHMWNVMVLPSQECDFLMENIFGRKISSYNKPLCVCRSGLCKRNRAVNALLYNGTLVGMTSYPQADCSPPYLYYNVYEGHDFLKCAYQLRTCETQHCENFCQEDMANKKRYDFLEDIGGGDGINSEKKPRETYRDRATFNCEDDDSGGSSSYNNLKQVLTTALYALLLLMTIN